MTFIQESNDPTTPAQETAQLDLEALTEQASGLLRSLQDWAETELFSYYSLLQFAAILGGFLVTWLIVKLLSRPLNMAYRRIKLDDAHLLRRIIAQALMPLLSVIALWTIQTIFIGVGLPSYFTRIAASLVTAWLGIRLVSLLLPEEIRKPVAYAIWVGAIISAFGFWGSFVGALEKIGFTFGGRFINVPFIFQAIIISVIFLVSANWLSGKLKTRIDTLPRVEPSLRILLSNIARIALFFIAALLVMTSLSIPLSGLALLTGALGIGIGFGMQQIVANFISGVILLTDRSIKPHDVIEVDDTYGVVKSLGLRYASVITRDGKEHLIPNEQLITDKVVNWSFSDRKVRLKRRVRVEYETDLRFAVGLVEGAISDVPRVLKHPTPKCLVMEFGEEAIEIEARFWISDPQNGVSNVSSEVSLAIWDKFKENGIDIPLRREEILIEPGSTINVKLDKS